jgi:hypothetical protein
VLFGEVVQALMPVDKAEGGVYRKHKLEERLEKGLWLGRTEESDEHLVALEGKEVHKIRSIRRLS